MFFLIEFGHLENRQVWISVHFESPECWTYCKSTHFADLESWKYRQTKHFGQLGTWKYCK